MDPLLLIVLAVIAAGVAGCAALILRQGGHSAQLTNRIDQLEATLKTAQSSNVDLTVAQLGERFEAKHRELSESVSGVLETRSQRIEDTVRQLKEANQEQLLKQERELRKLTEEKLGQVQSAIGKLQTDTAKQLGDLREGLAARLAKALQDASETTTHSLQRTMKLATETLNSRFADLQKVTDTRLADISGKVAERLDEGFKKTHETFTDVVKRLAIIDRAQQEITSLSKEVVSLQDILSDKKSRGVFGEVQLNQLVINTMPEGSYSLQHTLGDGKLADCVLFLPDPTGTVAVDSKFPLENYRRMHAQEASAAEKAVAARQFKTDIKNHIKAISEKYIVPGVTSDGAVMFIPAEAVFAEIHAHHPDLVELSQKARVWITSPTTMMAILTTARAVLKDAKTRKQVHIIQEHLGLLAKDFERFQKRMDNLSVHMVRVGKDVDEIGTSARKITSRFEKIEKVQLEGKAEDELPAPKAQAAGETPETEH